MAKTGREKRMVAIRNLGLRDYKWDRERKMGRSFEPNGKMAQTKFPQSLGLKKFEVKIST
jgi:hypothetical protein